MYCRYCGATIPADGAFCPQCGKAQDADVARKSGIPTWLIITLLIFFPPAGFILMWLSNWKRWVKIFLTGFLFPPIWLLLLWEMPFSDEVKAGIITGLVAANSLWLAPVAGATATIAFLIVTVVLGTLWIQSIRRSKSVVDDGTAALRRMIDSKVDTCHDLIAEIEGTLAFDLLPSDSPLRRQYMHALEMRSEGMELYERAASRPDLVAADARLTRAVEELRTARATADRTLA
jgi:predicted nucleic acid-binding Zn ribbon protein